MKLERVFDDLGDFVAAYRGAISREGMLHVADSHWPLGTTLKVDLRLVDGLALVKGLATVVRIQLLPNGEAGWVVALKFLDLDPASRDLLDRLETRNEGEGVPPFRLSDPIVAPPGRSARPAHRATPPPRSVPVDLGSAAGPAPPALGGADDEDYAPEHEPHPALGGDLAAAPPRSIGAPSERTVPLGSEPERTLAFEPLPPARPLRGSEATLPMDSDEPPVAAVPTPEPDAADGADDSTDGRGSRVRVLAWIAALAAVAVIGVTLTWLLVPELFSDGRVATRRARRR